MSYLVLARKWRPNTLDQVIGQSHVVQTLAHALDNDRIHHAYLFTGTRGVGKTTLARILAKAINCEQGVSSTPCGICGACTGIAEGRFIDLIEVDAASRTKVEDTRALLENVHYQSTQGRFKVYLIDEVHMLTGHSFNALLKTLEEPPDHVKFLLATTDPQKLPVTVLSRCIQFNLRAIQIHEICDQLSMILEKENIMFEQPALQEISRQARGSMRDALSLIDQAISFGGGKVDEQSVRNMLGMISRDHHERLLQGLVNSDAQAVMEAVEHIAQRGASYEVMLDELLLIFHQLALYRISDSVATSSGHELTAVIEIAAPLSDEDIQLYYQIGLIGKRDLPLAPDPKSGFEMVMLRMLAFRPQSSNSEPPKTNTPPRSTTVQNAPKPRPPEQRAVEAVEPQAVPQMRPPETSSNNVAIDIVPDSPQSWNKLVESLQNLDLQAQFLAQNLAFLSFENNKLKLSLDAESNNAAAKDAEQFVKLIEQAIAAQCLAPIELDIVKRAHESESLTQQNKREKKEADDQHQDELRQAKKRIMSEPIPQYLMKEMEAMIEESSVKLANSQASIH